MTKMNPEVKAKWLKALRSGRFHQGTGALCSTRPGRHDYCCLGVLCEVVRPGCFDRGEDADGPIAGIRSYPPDGLLLAAGLLNRAEEDDGLTPAPLIALSAMNDGTSAPFIFANGADITPTPGKKTFAQIADWIEEHL